MRVFLFSFFTDPQPLRIEVSLDRHQTLVVSTYRFFRKFCDGRL